MLYKDLQGFLNQAIPVSGQMLVPGTVLCNFYEKAESGLCEQPHLVLDWPKSNKDNTPAVMQQLDTLIKEIFPRFTCTIYPNDDKPYMSLYVTGITTNNYDLAPHTARRNATRDALVTILPQSRLLPELKSGTLTQNEQYLTQLRRLVPTEVSEHYEQSRFNAYDITLDNTTNSVIFACSDDSAGKLWVTELQQFCTEIDPNCCILQEQKEQYDHYHQLRITLTESLTKQLQQTDQWDAKVQQFHDGVLTTGQLLKSASAELATKRLQGGEEPIAIGELPSMQQAQSLLT